MTVFRCQSKMKSQKRNPGMKRHSKISVLAALGIFLSISVNPAFSDMRGTPDNVEESSLSTLGTCRLELLDLNGNKSPFNLYIDQKATGHLSPSLIVSRKYPRAVPEALLDGPLRNWIDRLTFLKPNQGWAVLSLNDAKSFWGKCRRHLLHEQEFFTFDSRALLNNEENVFHLDLSFGPKGVVTGYRIRGIGIVNPKWVTEEDFGNLNNKAK